MPARTRRILAVLALVVTWWPLPALAQVDPVPERFATVLPGTDLPGGDIESIFDITFQRCLSACLEDGDCYAFTFDQRNNACFLKDAAGSPTSFEGAVSGVITLKDEAALARARSAADSMPYLFDTDLEAARDQALGMAQSYASQGFGEAAWLELVEGDLSPAEAVSATGAAVTVNDSGVAWLAHARALIAQADEDDSWSLYRQATAAAINAAVRLPEEEMPAALLVLAQGLEGSFRGEQALAALRHADALAPGIAPVELRRLTESFGFRVLGHDVETLTAAPRVCISFSEELVDGHDYSPFVQRSAVGLAIEAQGQNLCITGVAYGQSYTFTLRAGLPSAVGDTLLLDDGLIALEVVEVVPQFVHCRVVIGGRLSDRKGINRQGGGLTVAALSDKDRADIRLAAELGIDFLAVSFVKTAADIEQARELLREAGGEAALVAKIERTEAIAALDEIIDAADVVMVARGDLGVEIGDAELPGLQKKIIRETLERNRVVITATQMMQSMVESPIPTRAEVLDVANAVIDGTDAVMLSGESAVGKYPVKAVQAMSQVILGAEKYESSHTAIRHRRDEDTYEKTDEAIAMAVMYTANHMRVRAIVALTESGSTPLWMSRIRADIPIYAFTRHEATQRRVMLYRGVYPVMFDITHTDSQKVYADISRTLLERGMVEIGDRIIMTKGEFSGVSGKTNSMKILEIRA